MDQQCIYVYFVLEEVQCFRFLQGHKTKRLLNYNFFFFESANFIKEQIPAQDEQRLVKHRIQTKGTVYRRNTRKINTIKNPYTQNT